MTSEVVTACATRLLCPSPICGPLVESIRARGCMNTEHTHLHTHAHNMHRPKAFVRLSAPQGVDMAAVFARVQDQELVPELRNSEI